LRRVERIYAVDAQLSHEIKKNKLFSSAHGKKQSLLAVLRSANGGEATFIHRWNHRKDAGR